MTTRVTTLMVCDFANVRENLLHVLGGGVTRAVVARFPGSAHVSLALVAYVPPDETGRSHDVKISIKRPETAEPLMETTVSIKPVGGQLLPGEGAQLPITVDLRGVVIPRPGPLDVQVQIDGKPGGDLTFWAVERLDRSSPA